MIQNLNRRIKLFWDILVINAFLLNLGISTISNYTKTSLILKIISTILLMFVVLIDARITNFNLTMMIRRNSFHKLFLSMSVIPSFGLISLSYSLNSSFGFEKVLHLIFSTIPAVLIFYYLVNNFSSNRIEAFRISVTTLVIISSLIIIFLNPLDHSTVYSFAFSRVSHVISGRFLGLFLVILMLFLIFENYLFNKILFGVLLLFGSYSLYLVGMRTATIGFFLISAIAFIYYLLHKQDKKLNLVILILSLLFSLILMKAMPGNNELSNRYSVFSAANTSKIYDDSGFSARLTAWDICLKRFVENPLLGVGFGGFRSFYESDISIWMKYPHNIILEFLVEFGFGGLLLCLFLFRFLYLCSIKTDTSILFPLLFVMILAQFSKDIPSQTTMFIFGGFLSNSNILYNTATNTRINNFSS